MLKQVVGGAGLVSAVDHSNVLVRNSRRDSRVRLENLLITPIRDLAGHDLRQGALPQLDSRTQRTAGVLVRQVDREGDRATDVGNVGPSPAGIRTRLER